MNELYRMCKVARELLQGDHAVGRVIARPFVGRAGAFQRTAQRKDFSLKPPAPTVLNSAQEAGLNVWGVGKIDNLFAGQGVSSCTHVKDNDEGISRTIELTNCLKEGILFTNLGDFDTLFGHRNNPRGFAAALQAFDRRLPEIQEAMLPGDIAFITADHGCDPTAASTDHSREYVPVLVWGAGVKRGVDLGTRSSFADLGATVASLMGLAQPPVGETFAQAILH